MEALRQRLGKIGTRNTWQNYTNLPVRKLLFKSKLYKAPGIWCEIKTLKGDYNPTTPGGTRTFCMVALLFFLLQHGFLPQPYQHYSIEAGDAIEEIKETEQLRAVDEMKKPFSQATHGFRTPAFTNHCTALEELTNTDDTPALSEEKIISNSTQ